MVTKVLWWFTAFNVGMAVAFQIARLAVEAAR
jgi:hypothetical protein